MRGAEPGLGGVDLGLGGLEGLLCLIEPGLRRPPVGEEFLLPSESIAGLGQLALGGRQVGLRLAQFVLRDLRIEPRDDLAGLHGVAHLDGALEEAPVKAEGETDLIPGADLAGEGYGLAGRARLHGHSADGPVGGGMRGRVVAAHERRGGQPRG